MTEHKCILCEQEYSYKDWWGKNTRGLETIRMHLGLCDKYYYAFKGDRVNDKQNKSEDVYLEITKEERCILWDLLRREMNHIDEYIIKEWSEGYYVTDHLGTSARVQKHYPQDMVCEQHQLLKLMRLFKKIRDFE